MGLFSLIPAEIGERVDRRDLVCSIVVCSTLVAWLQQSAPFRGRGRLTAPFPPVISPSLSLSLPAFSPLRLLPPPVRKRLRVKILISPPSNTLGSSATPLFVVLSIDYLF